MTGLLHGVPQIITRIRLVNVRAKLPWWTWLVLSELNGNFILGYNLWEIDAVRAVMVTVVISIE